MTESPTSAILRTTAIRARYFAAQLPADDPARGRLLDYAMELEQQADQMEAAARDANGGESLA